VRQRLRDHHASLCSRDSGDDLGILLVQSGKVLSTFRYGRRVLACRNRPRLKSVVAQPVRTVGMQFLLAPAISERARRYSSLICTAADGHPAFDEIGDDQQMMLISVVLPADRSGTRQSKDLAALDVEMMFVQRL